MRMEKKYFKKINRSLTPIGLGTWRLGSMGDKPIEVIRYGIENGVQMIDTAEAYAFGYEERLVGEAIKGYNRDDLFIVTKVFPSRRRNEVLESAIKSVDNLGTYIDLYLLHSPHIVEGTLEERMQGLEDVLDRGLTRFIGLSNFRVEQLDEARSYLRKYDIVALENRINLSDLYWYYELEEYTKKENLMQIAHTPIDTGRVKNDKDRILKVANAYGRTNIQIALNWLLWVNNIITIVKCGNVENLKECLGSMAFLMGNTAWFYLENKEQRMIGNNKKEYINARILKENMRYYFTPHFFWIYLKYYTSIKHWKEYISGTIFKAKNHL